MQQMMKKMEIIKTKGIPKMGVMVAIRMHQLITMVKILVIRSMKKKKMTLMICWKSSSSSLKY